MLPGSAVPFWKRLVVAAAGAGLFFGCVAATAQESDTGYTVREDGAGGGAIGKGTAEEAPVRLARFSYVRGSVSWREDDSSAWSTATVNLPLRQGAQVWVSDGGRAEIQFDDGSVARLGNNAVLSLQTLYSDSEGEFTELRLTEGLATLRLRHEKSLFQIDTPLVSVKATGPARIRVGASDGVEVGVREGAAAVEGSAGSVQLRSGEYLDLSDSTQELVVRPLPRPDSWELWNDDRDQKLESAVRDTEAHTLAPNIALVATDLDEYGEWQREPQYGWVWCPRVAAADWRPYYDGHWTWVNPFGWTWVSNEAWGWAPYHYGSWVRLAHRWAWVPGPAEQCWSPAVVHFAECDNRVVWCPLAPSEIRYRPALALAFAGRSWSLYFSIGKAAVYYPSTAGYCEARPFRTVVVNRYYVHNVTSIHPGLGALGRYRESAASFAANSNTYFTGRFVPVNSRGAYGASAASTLEFGARGRYEPLSQPGAGLFERGRSIGGPLPGHEPIAGPPAVRATAEATRPGRTYLPDRAPNVNRPVVRMPLPAAVARVSVPIRSSTTPSSGVSERRQSAGSGAVNQGAVGHRDYFSASGTQALTSSQIRAREARRALGAPAGSADPGSMGSQTPSERSGISFHRNDGRSEQQRSGPYADVRRDPTVRSQGARSYGSPGRDSGVRSPESGRYGQPAERGPGSYPSAGYGYPRADRAPAPPDRGRTGEIRSDPIVRQPVSPPIGDRSGGPVVRQSEPRRDPPAVRPNPAEPRREPVYRRPDPPVNPPPARQQPAPERRSPPPEPPKRDAPKSDDRSTDGSSDSKSGGSSPTTSRGRR